MLKIVVVCVGLFSWTKREKGILPVILRRFLKVFVAKMQPTAVICLKLYAAHANTEWKENGEEDLKRKHPVSSLNSSQGDEQMFYRIEHKKPGQLLAFELVDTNFSLNVVQPISVHVPEVPVEPSDLQQIKTTREASCQTDKAGCHYRQSKAEKGTSVKVGTGQPISATLKSASLHHCYYEL